MAIATRLIGVRADGCRAQPLMRLVTAHAAGRTDREIDAESVAVLTARRLRDAEGILRMQRVARARVALLADLHRRRRERITVAVATRQLVLVDVHAMAGALAHGLPHRRHLLGCSPLARSGARDHEREDRDPHR
jgi:hypothetical protein